MTEFDLLDAFGNIEPALLERSEHRTVRRLPLRKCLIAAAAVMLLAMSALATPAVQKWINGPTMTRVQIGRPYKTADSEYFIESFARVDLNLENPGITPSTIRELRVPTYFEHGPRWTYYPDIREPEETALTSYLGSWELDDKSLIFQQKTIVQNSREHPAGYGQFTIDLGNNAHVEQTDITIGEQTYRVFQVSVSKVDIHTRFDAHTDVIWSDGEYAYHIIAKNIDLDQISSILRTIEPVDMENYIRDARFDPIEIYYTLPSPYGHSGQPSWQMYGYRSRQFWGLTDYGISLEQRRIQSDESEIQTESLEELLEELRQNIFFYGVEQIDVDGMTVYIAHTAWDQRVLWQQDGYIFLLEFYGYRQLNNLKIENYVRSLTPVEELGKLPAE